MKNNANDFKDARSLLAGNPANPGPDVRPTDVPTVMAIEDSLVELGALPGLTSTTAPSGRPPGPVRTNP